MIRRVKALNEYTIHGTDGDVGKVDDVYFDDCSWKVRYFVVDTGPWQLGRKVLLTPDVVYDIPVGERRIIRTKLTKRQIKDSPDINLAKPVSQEQLKDLHNFYNWPWREDTYPSAVVYTPAGIDISTNVPPTLYVPADDNLPDLVNEELKQAYYNDVVENTCLRSCRDIIGYRVQAQDGPIGHIEDFFVDEEGWVMRYLLVNTRNWLAGRSVLLATDWVTAISWGQKDVYVKQDKETIWKSPEYNHSKNLPREYEILLQQHYGHKVREMM
jgi:uncharacterized protein YrrD